VEEHLIQLIGWSNSCFKSARPGDDPGIVQTSLRFSAGKLFLNDDTQRKKCWTLAGHVKCALLMCSVYV